MKIINKLVADLIPYVNNARTHSDQQIAQIASSIKEFGFCNPVLIDGQNGIIAGHGRVLAAQKLGLKEVPTIELSHLTDTQRKAYILADNRLAELSGWDDELLKLELTGLELLEFDLSLIGFDDFDLSVETVGGLTDEDAVPEVPEVPVTKLGDVWLLGNHRLMCGDSTSIDAVDKLIAKGCIDTVYTDPPYGINEKGDRSNREGAAKGTKYTDFIDDSVQYAIDAYNLCSALNIPRQVWWGANYYCHALPLSNNWFVWDKRVEENQKDTQSDCELAWVKSKWSSVRIFRHLWKGMCKGSEHGQHRVHPTQKPIALAEWCLDYFKESKVVLDLFGGSGSTLIACEKTNRINYSMELDEKYCDVIVKRWQEYTGKQATLESTGEFFGTIKEES